MKWSLGLPLLCWSLACHTCCAFLLGRSLTSTTLFLHNGGSEDSDCGQDDENPTPTTTSTITTRSGLYYAFETLSRYTQEAHHQPLWESLMLHDPIQFSSKSQAKRACRLGHVVLRGDGMSGSVSSPMMPPKAADDPKEGSNRKSTTKNGCDLTRLLENPFEILSPGDIIDIQTRRPNPEFCYPAQVTKHVMPPVDIIDDIKVVYQDDQVAVVVKPENMTTIGGGRQEDDVNSDLQSCLGFVLYPSPTEPDYHPRPVHRLDRRTSGLVVVAKTTKCMQFLSKAFAQRRVCKTYTALVSRLPTQSQSQDAPQKDNTWIMIDYPIDGKSAISEYRWMQCTPITIPETSTAMNNATVDCLCLVQVRPRTGRTHQIRRHLAYCLNAPIVGDAKYDKGAKHLRTDGMYLCCHELEFPLLTLPTASTKPVPNPEMTAHATYPRRGNRASAATNASGSTIQHWVGNQGDDQEPRLRVSIPLPHKFRTRLVQFEQ